MSSDKVKSLIKWDYCLTFNHSVKVPDCKTTISRTLSHIAKMSDEHRISFNVRSTYCVVSDITYDLEIL